ncbi:MAG: hypothetical protein HRT47_10740 [Candidatus Caenarcaniphilales bacterium]|nr:hypothetical protein [Candidatus Caenarcaniphilales bacterium]
MKERDLDFKILENYHKLSSEFIRFSALFPAGCIYLLKELKAEISNYQFPFMLLCILCASTIGTALYYRYTSSEVMTDIVQRDRLDQKNDLQNLSKRILFNLKISEKLLFISGFLFLLSATVPFALLFIELSKSCT